MVSVVLVGQVDDRVTVTVPEATNTLSSSAVISQPIVDNDGTWGGVHLGRAAITTGVEAFSYYLSNPAERPEGFLCQIGFHPPIPVSAGKTLIVTFESPGIAVLYFDFSAEN